jgi:putative transposase
LLKHCLTASRHKDLRKSWLAAIRSSVEATMTPFAKKYARKYEKDCLIKDREALRRLFGIPPDKWDHLRTTNPIERMSSMVSHHAIRKKAAVSQDTARLMVVKLAIAVEALTAPFRTPPTSSRVRHAFTLRAP